MAGTAHPGMVDKFDLSPALHFIGQTIGLGLQFHQWESGDLITNGSPVLQDFRPMVVGFAGPRTAAEAAGTPSTPVAIAGNDRADAVMYNQDWFERVHIMPKAEIEFGNIITLEQADYELFNAYRTQSTTLITITNNVAPGVSLPNLTPPVTKGPLSSFLDSTSTPQTTTALGTLVKLKVNAEATGLPLFDGTIDFLFSTGDEVSLFLSGTRIVLIPFEYEAPTTESLAFLTDIIEALNGKEQRIALRKQGRQAFSVEYALDENERQRMQVLLLDWMDRVFGFPLWHEMVELTAAVSPGATNYPVANADDVDFRVGGMAVIMTDANTFDVLNITAVTPTQITAADPSVNGYPRGTRIMPLRVARITQGVPARRSLNNLEVFRIEFEVTENDIGAPTGSTAGWSTYNGRVLLDDCNASPGEMPERYARRLYVIDNQTGIVNVRSAWDRNKREQMKGFVARSRADILKLRRLLSALGGRWKSWYIPSFFPDLTVKANLSVATSTMDIENIEYTRFAAARHPVKVFKITFTDGSNLVRVIQSSAKISATTERLTLDTTWPANRTVAEIVRVQFYELVRFDTDKFTLTYPRIGLASLQAPVIAVFDDN